MTNDQNDYQDYFVEIGYSEIEPAPDSAFISKKALDLIEKKVNNWKIFLSLVMKRFFFKSSYSKPEDLRSALSELFREIGIPDEDAKKASFILARAHFIKTCEREWADIPTYVTEKVRRKNDWDPTRHYIEYWRPWVERGALYQDQMRKYDSGFIDAVRSFCKRNGKDPDKYIPPPKKERITRELEQIELMSPRDAARLRQNLSTRRHRNSRNGEASDGAPAASIGS